MGERVECIFRQFTGSSPPIWRPGRYQGCIIRVRFTWDNAAIITRTNLDNLPLPLPPRECENTPTRVDTCMPCAHLVRIDTQKEIRGHSRHIYFPPVVPGPDTTVLTELLSERVVGSSSVGCTDEEGHRIVQVGVVDLDGDVAARVRSAMSPGGDGGGTYWTQGWIRSAYHSGKTVDLWESGVSTYGT